MPTIIDGCLRFVRNHSVELFTDYSPYLKVFLKSLEVNNRSRLKQRLKSATAFTKYYSDVQHSLVVRSNIKHYSSTSIAKTIDFHYTCGDKFAQKRVLLVVRYPSSKSDICPTFPKWQHS